MTWNKTVLGLAVVVALAVATLGASSYQPHVPELPPLPPPPSDDEPAQTTEDLAAEVAQLRKLVAELLGQASRVSPSTNDPFEVRQVRRPPVNLPPPAASNTRPPDIDAPPSLPPIPDAGPSPANSPDDPSPFDLPTAPDAPSVDDDPFDAIPDIAHQLRETELPRPRLDPTPINETEDAEDIPSDPGAPYETSGELQSYLDQLRTTIEQLVTRTEQRKAKLERELQKTNEHLRTLTAVRNVLNQPQSRDTNDPFELPPLGLNGSSSRTINE